MLATEAFSGAFRMLYATISYAWGTMGRAGAYGEELDGLVLMEEWAASHLSKLSVDSFG